MRGCKMGDGGGGRLQGRKWKIQWQNGKRHREGDERSQKGREARGDGKEGEETTEGLRTNRREQSENLAQCGPRQRRGEKPRGRTTYISLPFKPPGRVKRRSQTTPLIDWQRPDVPLIIVDDWLRSLRRNRGRREAAARPQWQSKHWRPRKHENRAFYAEPPQSQNIALDWSRLSQSQLVLSRTKSGCGSNI